MSYKIDGFGPSDLLTSDKEKIRRMQVDVGNTGFFDSREFRYFREFRIPPGSSWWMRVTVPEDGIILRTQNIAITDGQLRFRVWRELTIDATFVAPGTPVDVHTNDLALSSGFFPQNGLPASPPFVGQTEIVQSEAEVSVSGGICSEAERLRTSGATAQKQVVGFTTDDERGVPPGVYHLELQSLGTGGDATGTYTLKFEERLGQG